jgi:fucose permease
MAKNTNTKFVSANIFLVIYAGYFFGQYPCGWLIGRFPAQRVLAISILLWGITVLLMTQARSYPSACKFTYLYPTK